MNKLLFVLKKHKEGLLVGGLVGAAAAYYLLSQGQDLSSLASAGKGLFDDFLGRSANPLVDAQNKLYVVFILLGMIVGYAVDLLLARTLLKTRRSRAKTFGKWRWG